jgi:hypothetical protein
MLVCHNNEIIWTHPIRRCSVAADQLVCPLRSGHFDLRAFRFWPVDPLASAATANAYSRPEAASDQCRLCRIRIG